MTRDAHRAPSRLSPPRQVNSRGAPMPPRPHRPHYPQPDYTPYYPDRSASDPAQEWPSTTPGSGTHRFDDAPRADSDELVRQPAQVRTSRADEAPGEPPMDYLAEQHARANELSKQERTQLLMETIQLFDDVWKLASIRANERNNWLTAYLVPRNKNLDLRTAISKRQVLIITIDEMGNTDIREPQKRGLWRRLTAWLIGE